MKKKFMIPLFQIAFSIYWGDKGWDEFKRVAIANGSTESSDSPMPAKGSGRAYGSRIWVHDLENEGVIVHEISHSVDDIMDHLASKDTEIRARIMEWLYVAVMKFARKQR